jgi:hypothetical protein
MFENSAYLKVIVITSAGTRSRSRDISLQMAKFLVVIIMKTFSGFWQNQETTTPLNLSVPILSSLQQNAVYEYSILKAERG